MSPVSSSTLFHFTNKMRHLVDILTNEFYPHYSLEDLGRIQDAQVSSASAMFAFPLVAFCDIPLSQASVHMSTYGRYAIGLTKEWGMRMRIAPVVYCYPDSPASRSIATLLRLTAGEGKGRPNELVAGQFGYLSAFLKPYEGPSRRRGKQQARVRFYDEREWRYVPSGVSLPVLSQEEYLDPATLKRANQEARTLFSPLSFEPSDIRYIVVRRESEILPMIRSIEQAKGKYDEDTVKVLASRIISTQSIRRDF